MIQVKVLIVDDEMAIRNSLAAYFEDAGFIPVMAADGESGLELLKSGDFDAVITDMRMTGITGETFIRTAHEKYPALVFLVHTGSPNYELPTSLADMQCVSPTIFLKPISDMNVFYLEVCRMLEGR